MAYPTNNLAFTLEDINRQIITLKAYCQGLVTQSAASGLQSVQALTLYTNLKQYRAALEAAKAVPGLGAYAQQQTGSPTLDVAAEFNALVAAIDNATSWLAAALPKDANGFLLVQTFDPASGAIDRQFTSAETAGLRTVLNAIVARIA